MLLMYRPCEFSRVRVTTEPLIAALIIPRKNLTNSDTKYFHTKPHNQEYNLKCNVQTYKNRLQGSICKHFASYRQ